MKRATMIVALSASLSACMTTPVVMLKNQQTGQIARCGGNTTNTLASGYVQHANQTEDDERCVADYEAQGFRVLDDAAPQTAEATASTRLKELDQMLIDGTISNEEYDRKRKEVLQGV